MTEKTKKAAKSADPSQTGSVSEKSYEPNELMQYSIELFGVKPEVVAGAIHGKKQGKFTVIEMKKMIDQFLNRKVDA